MARDECTNSRTKRACNQHAPSLGALLSAQQPAHRPGCLLPAGHSPLVEARPGGRVFSAGPARQDGRRGRQAPLGQSAEDPWGNCRQRQKLSVPAQPGMPVQTANAPAVHAPSSERAAAAVRLARMAGKDGATPEGRGGLTSGCGQRARSARVRRRSTRPAAGMQ